MWAVETPTTTIFVDKLAGRTHRLRAIVPKVDEGAAQARAIARVRALHAPFEWSFGQGTVRSCTECARLGGDEGEAQYPCSTIRALDGIEHAPRHAPRHAPATH